MNTQHYTEKRSTLGVTLLELSFTVAILTLVIGVLFTLTMGIGNSARVQEAGVELNESARESLNAIVTELRQAQRLSISSNNTFPGNTLKYRVASDVDGNGTAVNKSGSIELSPQRTIQRDTNDVNGDGLTVSQLVILEGNAVRRVLANNLNSGTETNTDSNSNGRLDRGFWVSNAGGTLTVSVQTEEQLNNGRSIAKTYSAVVRPRN